MPGFVVGSETSLQAAESIVEQAPTLRSKVLIVLLLRGAVGATDDELASLIGLRRQTLSARRRELVLLGQVEASGSRRVARSGRTATVWVATGKSPRPAPSSTEAPPVQAQSKTLQDLRKLWCLARTHGVELNGSCGDVVAHWTQHLRNAG